jgi:hypothetical protein
MTKGKTSHYASLMSGLNSTAGIDEKRLNGILKPCVKSTGNYGFNEMLNHLEIKGKKIS